MRTLWLVLMVCSSHITTAVSAHSSMELTRSRLQTIASVGLAVSHVFQNPSLMQSLVDCATANLTSHGGACDLKQAISETLNTSVEQVESGKAISSRKLPTHAVIDSWIQPLTLLQQSTASSAPTNNVAEATNSITWRTQEVMAYFLLAFAWVIELGMSTEMPAFLRDFLENKLHIHLTEQQANPECQNSGKVDDHGRDCTYYESDPGSTCYEGGSLAFSPVDECCACKRDLLSRSVSNMESVREKWKVVSTVYGSFDRWLAIWSKKNNGIERVGGVNSICYDWLPLIHKLYRKGLSSSIWQCDPSAVSVRMGDPADIFTVNPGEIIPSEEDAASGEKIVRATVGKLFTKVHGSTENCNLPSKDFRCDIAYLVETFVNNPFIRRSEFVTAEAVTEFAFRNRKLKEETIDYFCSPGPRSRLRYVFDMVDGANPDPHAAEYVLPKDDLQLCWRIMETSLAKQSRQHKLSFKDLGRALVMTILYIMFSIQSLSLVFNRFTLMDAAKRSSSCRSIMLEGYDPASMIDILCTNSYSDGSYCVASCKPGYGSDLDGIERQLFNLCSKSKWQIPPEQFHAVCLPVVPSDRTSADIFV